MINKALRHQTVIALVCALLSLSSSAMAAPNSEDQSSSDQKSESRQNSNADKASNSNKASKQSWEADKDLPGGALARQKKLDELIKAANHAYNEGDYDQAATEFRQIIQLDPARQSVYRNLARSYFWQATYPEAVAYYDIYLRIASDADDRDQVQSERRLAASRAGDRVWSTPPAQAQALAALEAALENGHAYTAGAGGAWGIYNALLRAGYAQPELAGLKRRLVRNLLTEFVGLLVAPSGQPTPALDLDDWRVQQERLDAAASLSDDTEVLEVINQRAALTQAAVALLTDRHARARQLSQRAAEANPDLPFVLWFQARAEVEDGDPAAALKTLDELSANSAAQHPDHKDYIEVFRAAILQRMNRPKDAASIYLDLVSERGHTSRTRQESTQSSGK